MTQSTCTAIILASGSGTRMGVDTPKQYLTLLDVPVLRWSVEAFKNHPLVTHVQVVINAEHYVHYKKTDIGLDILPVTIGGATRQQSAYNGLLAVKNLLAPAPDDKILIHDAARPMVSAETITNVCLALDDFNAVIPVKKIADTIKSIDAENFVTGVIDRENLRAVETPQGFRFGTIFEAHEKLKNESLTDDASLVEKMGIKVKTVLSVGPNNKITTQEDLQYAEFVMRTIGPQKPYYTNTRKFFRKPVNDVIIPFGYS